MQIIHDHSYISQSEREFISRGYACESMYSLRFSFIYTEAQQAESRAYAETVGLGSDAWGTYTAASAKQRSQHMAHIAAVMAQNFKVCQYGGEDDVPYSSDWELFFWCNDFTMRKLPAGRDYGYFTLSFNSGHSPERRQKILDRAMRILEPFADDKNLHVAVQYEAVMDGVKIKRDARMVIPKIAGQNCVYGSMEGRVETNGETLFFRKKRSRKYVYRLTDTEVLSISWQLSVQT